MYKILKDVGIRDVNKEVMREEFFTPYGYKAHFEKVSKGRVERTVEEIDEGKHKIPKIEDEEYLKQADLMEQEISKNEFDRGIKLIHNGAPGEDGIMIKTLRDAGEKNLSYVLNKFFMDITKAYPRLNGNILWHVLRKLGIKNVMLKTLQNLHERTEYKIKGRTLMSEAWEPQRGLREGYATSSLLFNIYHACVMKLAEK